MKAGRLRHRLRIEKPTPTTVDGYQGEVKHWTTVTEVGDPAEPGVVDAAIDSITGREFLAADRELAGITWRITLREVPGVLIEPGWRGVEIDGDALRTFDFVAVLPSHERSDITLAATSGQSQP